MEENEKTGLENETPKKDGKQTGTEFVKRIKPIGVIFFLFLLVMFFFVCFSSCVSPVKGYKAPKDSAYYAGSDATLSELKTELEENVFPSVEGVISSEVEDGKLTVVTEDEKFVTVRAALLRYYDEGLFNIEKESEHNG